jgi:SpoIID/LytB domain protein
MRLTFPMPGRRALQRAAAVSIGALLPLAAVVPQAAAADTWRVPANARVVVKGHGYGHGHGMSQYGAEGAARSGLNYRQIARFYYPGTDWGTVGGRVEVLISSDTTGDVVVLSRAGLRVREVGGQQWTLPDNGAARWRLLAGRGSRTVVAYRDGVWKRWKVLTGAAEFHAGGAPVALVTPQGTRHYRGRIRAAVPAGQPTARDTVNVLSLHHYLRGVVPLEMPALWSPAAVQAQAVAARTYAAYERAHPRASHYQICDTTSCQVYGGYDAEHPATNAAINATRGEALLFGGAPAFTQFASSSGGWTAAGSVPYLRAQADPYDDWPGNPVHTWSVSFTDNQVERAFPRIGNLRRLTISDRTGDGQWGGRVGSLRLVGSKATITVSGDSARSALGLRSTWFTFRIRPAG